MSCRVATFASTLTTPTGAMAAGIAPRNKTGLRSDIYSEQLTPTATYESRASHPDTAHTPLPREWHLCGSRWCGETQTNLNYSTSKHSATYSSRTAARRRIWVARLCRMEPSRNGRLADPIRGRRERWVRALHWHTVAASQMSKPSAKLDGAPSCMSLYALTAACFSHSRLAYSSSESSSWWWPRRADCEEE